MLFNTSKKGIQSLRHDGIRHYSITIAPSRVVLRVELAVFMGIG